MYKRQVSDGVAVAGAAAALGVLERDEALLLLLLGEAAAAAQQRGEERQAEAAHFIDLHRWLSLKGRNEIS